MHLALLRKRCKTKHQHYELPKKQCETKCRLLTPSAERCLMNNLVFDTTLTGEIALPAVTFHELPAKQALIPPESDEEYERLKHRLGKASEILQRKRARVH